MTLTAMAVFCLLPVDASPSCIHRDMVVVHDTPERCAHEALIAAEKELVHLPGYWLGGVTCKREIRK